MVAPEDQVASARPALSPTSRRVLRHDVLDSLHTRILNGQLAPGTRLLEVGLSQRLGVSRGPVREAIRQLEQQGLVEFFPHRGAIVVGVSDEEVGPIYDVRAVLEARAFARATRSVTPADLAELNGLIDAMVEALDRRDYGAIVDLDLAFHGRVVELSGFRLLRQVWASLDSLVRGQTRLDLDSTATPDERDARFRIPALSHRARVDGLSSGRPALAADAARRHIQDASRRLRRAGRPAPQRGDRSRISR
jgi:DNA-binding GntR family transcriptional regulator